MDGLVHGHFEALVASRIDGALKRPGATNAF